MTRPAVLIPTYDNGRSLARVVEGVLARVPDVLVVDDGSTDDTPAILERFGERIQVHRHTLNQGKGRALRNGFRVLREAGFTHAVVVDSDGQHFPEDLPDFLAAIDGCPEALVVGERDMARVGAPSKSRLGLWFSNRALRWFTGVRLEDTQSGFRAYPLAAMERLDLVGDRFDFELEVLVKAGWAGVPFVRLPIRTTYLPDEGRVSHFRPLQDFLQIALQMIRLLGARLLGRRCRQ